ncbi:MAG: disulfide bond formation protein B [Xanthomonadaceae bacterium]|nr:disulfide bond formation protein B [Xanthomonadaceae bacterium]
MNPFRWSFRTQYLMGFLACVCFIAYAIYTQFFDDLEPCPLCIFQRIAFAALGLVFLVGGLHSPRKAGGRGFYACVALIAGVVGMGIAGRHVWLQHQPLGSGGSCGPTLAFMTETMGPMDLIRKVLTGTGDCGAVDWKFLGLSMPEWSLICFVVMTLWALYAGFKKRKSSWLH